MEPWRSTNNNRFLTRNKQPPLRWRQRRRPIAHHWKVERRDSSHKKKPFKRRIYWLCNWPALTIDDESATFWNKKKEIRNLSIRSFIIFIIIVSFILKRIKLRNACDAEHCRRHSRCAHTHKHNSGAVTQDPTSLSLSLPFCFIFLLLVSPFTIDNKQQRQQQPLLLSHAGRGVECKT